MQRDITVFTFVTIVYVGNVHLFCCILIVFSVIFSDVKAEKLPHAKKMVSTESVKVRQLAMHIDRFHYVANLYTDENMILKGLLIRVVTVYLS